jgi:DNA modification methylase
MYRFLKPTGSLWIAIGPKDFLDLEYPLAVDKKTDFLYVERIVQNAHSKESKEISPFKIVSEDLTTWYHFSKTNGLYFNPYEIKRNNSPVWTMSFSNIEDPIDKALEINHFIADTMNVGIPENLIKMFSKSGQVVFDPFGGSALVAVTAAKLGRIGISGDISEDMTKAAVDRCLLSGVEYTVDTKFV